MDVEALEALLRAGTRPGLVYVIPSFQNPAGVTHVAGQARAAGGARHRARLPAVEDDPYGELRFEGEPPPTMLSLDRRRARPLLDDLHQDRGARRPRRRAGDPDRAARAPAAARQRHLHRPRAAEPGDRRGVLRGRALRAQPGPASRAACASAATRSSPPSTATSASAPCTSSRRAATSCGCGCPASTPTRWRRRADEAGVPFVKGSSCFIDGSGRRRAAARLLGRAARGHGRGHRAPRRAAVGSGFSSRRTTYGEVVPSNPPDDSRQPDELQELLTLLGAAAQLAGCWLYVEDRFSDGTVRSAYDAPGFGALFGDPTSRRSLARPRAGRGRGDPERPRHRRARRSLRRALPAARGRRRRARGARPRPRPPHRGRRRAGVGTVQDITDEHEMPRDGAPHRRDDRRVLLHRRAAPRRHLRAHLRDQRDRPSARRHPGGNDLRRGLARGDPPRRPGAGRVADGPLRAGEQVDVEYRMVGFDGVTRWIWVRCAVRETSPTARASSTASRRT